MSTPATHFSNHDRKETIRKYWCKPLIQTLSTLLDKKLIYIGLPDIEALDVLEWIDYIDRVIAFQCSSYKDQIIDVSKLDSLLENLERQNKLRSSVVYQGWMEDILMGAISERGQLYVQNEFLKVYNLDFCSSLSFPRNVVNDRGKIVSSIYKTDIIDKFMHYQSIAAKENKGEKFIMYLTVNSDTFTLSLDGIKNDCIKKYLKELVKVKKPEVVAVRQMKAYCFHILSGIFSKYNFHIEFLPPVFYLGSSYPNREKGGKLDNHRMMTFTILGTKMNEGDELFKQDCETFLNNKFIFATDKKIDCYNDDRYISEVNYNPDIQEIIKQSYTYRKLWSA